MAILGWGDYPNGLEWVVIVKQTVMSNWNSESLHQEKEKMAGSMEKVRLDPEAWEDGRMKRGESETRPRWGTVGE